MSFCNFKNESKKANRVKVKNEVQKLLPKDENQTKMPLKWQPQFVSANELRNLRWAKKLYAPFDGLFLRSKECNSNTI